MRNLVSNWFSETCTGRNFRTVVDLVVYPLCIHAWHSRQLHIVFGERGLANKYGKFSET